MMGIAMRTAQRLGIHNEAANARQTVFRAEMRRRLWWSLMLFDSRVNDVANASSSLQIPTWDCRLPLNVNDSELRPDMTEQPAPHDKLSDCCFPFVRSVLGDSVRHLDFHIDLINPRLKRISKGGKGKLPDVQSLERALEERFLGHCLEEHPLQSLAMWSTRAQLARYRVLELYWQKAQPAHGEQHDWAAAATRAALAQLECDTKTMKAHLMKRHHWFLRHSFPLPAYTHILGDLKTPSREGAAHELWNALNENFVARFSSENASSTLQLRAVGGAIMEAWKKLKPLREGLADFSVPELVLNAEKRLHEVTRPSQDLFSTSLASTLGDARFVAPHEAPGHYRIMDCATVQGLALDESHVAHALDWD